MIKFCKDLREHATVIIKCQKKRNTTSDKERKRNTKNKNVGTSSKKNLMTCSMRMKSTVGFVGKYRGVAHIICNLRYKRPEEIPVIFYNGSNCDYHFLIEEVAEELEGQSEKYITPLPIKKENENIKTDIQNKIHWQHKIYGDLTDNLAEGLHKGKCEKCRSGFGYTTVKGNTLTFRCVDCNRDYEKEFL